MSRLHKVVDVEGPGGAPLSVTVHELTVGQIIDLMNSGQEQSSTQDFKKFLELNIGKFSSLTFDQAKEMAPSDLKKVYMAFKEVNEVFFEVAREAGLANLLAELKRAVVEDFSRLLVGSLNQVMAKRSSATDTPSS